MIQLNQEITIDLYVRGAWFIPETEVTIEGVQVNGITYVNDNLIIVNVTTPAVEGIFPIEVTNQTGETVVADAIEVKLSEWVDLRENGEVFQDGDIRTLAGMTINRDADGMYFEGAAPWSSWVKFESFQWTRGENKTLEWILTNPTTAMMIGIGSNATNETSTIQYSQAEIQAYFNAATSLWGLHGNTGTVGAAGNQNNTTAISANSVFKIKFEMDGGVGSVFTMYELPSADQSDWDNEDNIVVSFQVGGTLNPDLSLIHI